MLVSADEETRLFAAILRRRQQCLALTVDHALGRDDVVANLEHVKAFSETPRRIKVDNESEFVSKALDL